MKVVTGCIEVGGKRQRFHRGGIESARVSFADLHSSAAEEEAFGENDESVLLECIAGNEKVGDSGFILERDEAMSLGRSGSLATDDQARTCDMLTMRNGGEITCSEKSPGKER